MPFGLSLSKPQRNRRLLHWARVLWASPNTLIGIVLGLLLLPLGARFRRVDGVLEIAALRNVPRRRWPFAAVTCAPQPVLENHHR
ncbi:hypothetical protein [Hydrogenophaga sp.]|uniref:hypothetical protein n=1 Tax=Hydrogenophaga sp. TaxID=1904254 RepID=UPI002736D8CB|nr:hypothetical protein [Hydrogenophaga sp.]MDP3888376.1 hypothetical protein [Hydrogenophaga sp.]